MAFLQTMQTSLLEFCRGFVVLQKCFRIYRLWLVPLHGISEESTDIPGSSLEVVVVLQKCCRIYRLWLVPLHGISTEIVDIYSSSAEVVVALPKCFRICKILQETLNGICAESAEFSSSYTEVLQALQVITGTSAWYFWTICRGSTEVVVVMQKCCGICRIL